MIKTGLEIVEMIKDGKAPNKIKINDNIYEFQKEYLFYQNEDMKCIDLIKCLNDEFEIIEDKVWKPKKGENYWVITNSGFIVEAIWIDDEGDELRYEVGNCFKTKEEAEKYLEKIKIYVKLKKYAEEHNVEKIDWKNNKQAKWYIYYETIEKQIKVEGYPWTKHIGQIYFTSDELCKQAIAEIGEDNIKKLFEEE